MRIGEGGARGDYCFVSLRIALEDSGGVLWEGNLWPGHAGFFGGRDFVGWVVRRTSVALEMGKPRDAVTGINARD